MWQWARPCVYTVHFFGKTSMVIRLLVLGYFVARSVVWSHCGIRLALVPLKYRTSQLISHWESIIQFWLAVGRKMFYFCYWNAWNNVRDFSMIVFDSERISPFSPLRRTHIHQVQIVSNHDWQFQLGSHHCIHNNSQTSIVNLQKQFSVVQTCISLVRPMLLYSSHHLLSMSLSGSVHALFSAYIHRPIAVLLQIFHIITHNLLENKFVIIHTIHWHIWS